MPQIEQIDCGVSEAELAADLSLKQDLSEKSQANGYASLDGTGKVPTAELPAISGIPVGGATNNILAKLSATDGDAGWTAAPIVDSLVVGGSSLTSGYAVDITGGKFRLFRTAASTGDLLDFDLTSDGAAARFTFIGYVNNSAGVFGVFRKARGSQASPVVVIMNDQLGSLAFTGWDGVSAFQNVGGYNVVVIEPTPGPTAMAVRHEWTAPRLGTITRVGLFRAGFSAGLEFDSSVILDINRLFKLRSYTVATLPSASTSGAGATAYVTDALTPVFGNTVANGGSAKVPVYSDGTNWLVG